MRQPKVQFLRAIVVSAVPIELSVCENAPCNMPLDGALGAGFGGELMVCDPLPPAIADGAVAKPPASDSPAAATSAKAKPEMRLFVVAFMMMFSSSMGCLAIRLHRSTKLASNWCTALSPRRQNAHTEMQTGPAKEPVAVSGYVVSVISR